MGSRPRASNRRCVLCHSQFTIDFNFPPPPELEAILLVTGALDLPDRPGTRRNYDDDEEDDLEDLDDDPSSRMRSAATSTNARPPKNISSSQTKKDESDSEFEFDM